MTLEKALARLRDVDFGKPVHVVKKISGHDFGSAIAIKFGSRLPEILEKISDAAYGLGIKSIAPDISEAAMRAIPLDYSLDDPGLHALGGGTWGNLAKKDDEGGDYSARIGIEPESGLVSVFLEKYDDHSQIAVAYIGIDDLKDAAKDAEKAAKRNAPRQ